MRISLVLLLAAAIVTLAGLVANAQWNECDKSMIATYPCAGTDKFCKIKCNGQLGTPYENYSNAMVYAIGLTPGTLRTAGTRDLDCVLACNCGTAVVTYAKCNQTTGGCDSTGPFDNQNCTMGTNCIPTWSTTQETLFQSCIGS